MLPALLPDRPLMAAELNAHWAAARLPFRLDRHGVAHLWAVCAADAAVPQPLLFIVGREPQAVNQAQRWAAALARQDHGPGRRLAEAYPDAACRASFGEDLDVDLSASG